MNIKVDAQKGNYSLITPSVYLRHIKVVISALLDYLRQNFVRIFTSNRKAVKKAVASALDKVLHNLSKQSTVRIVDQVSRTKLQANTKHLYNICTMLDQRRRRWADAVQMLYKCFLFAGM